MEIFNIIFCTLVFLTFSIKQNNKIYDKETFDILKGIAILGVFVGHCSKVYLGVFLYKLLCSIGLFSVSLFFFISGYGLMYGLDRKIDFGNHFIRKRIIPILLNYIIVLLIYYLINAQKNINVKDVLLCSYIPFSWYILSILCLYIMFYVSIFISKKGNNVIMYVSVFLMIFIAITNHFNDKLPYPYLGGLQMITFVIGMIVYNSLRLKHLLKNKKMMFVLTFVFMLLWAYMLCHKDLNIHLLSTGFCESIISYVFPLMIISVLKYLQITRLLSFWSFLQKHTLQIYLIHGIVLFNIVNHDISSELMIFIIFFITILSSICLNKIVSCSMYHTRIRQ